MNATLTRRDSTDTTSPVPPWMRPFIESATSELAILAARGDGLWRAIEADRAALGKERDQELRIRESYREAARATPDSALEETHRAQKAIHKRIEDGNDSATANNVRKSTVTGYVAAGRTYGKHVDALGEKVRPAKVSLPKDMHPADVVSQMRAQETDLRDQRRTVAAAEMPYEDAFPIALAGLDAYEKPLVEARIKNGRVTHYFPVTEVGAEPRGPGIPNAPDAIAIALAINRPAIEEAVRESLKAQYRDIPLTLTAPEKKRKLAEIDADILDCQMVECAAIRAAREQGFDIEYRKGLDVRAVLGVEGPPPPRERP